MTSSTVSIVYPQKGVEVDIFDESHWSDPESCDPYERSKTEAEKAAWKFIEELPEADKFELTTINPGMILGPSMIKTDFSSGKVIKSILTGEFGGVLPLSFPTVDVRDCA